MTAEREAMTLEQVRTRLRDLVRQAPDEMDSVIVPIRELIGFAHAIDAALSRAAEPVGDEMVRLALDARCGSWSVRQLFQDEDEAPEIMRSALAAALFGIGVPVAWQIRAPKGGRDWEPCTRADYEATLRTGRYMGFPEGTKFVETRALYTRPLEPADAKDAARYRWLRGRGYDRDSYGLYWELCVQKLKRFGDTESPQACLDAAIDAAMAQESGE